MNWTANANRTNHYCPEVNEQDDCPRKDEIYLNRDAFTSTTVLIHEIGVMDDVYDDDYPQTNCPNPHTIQGQSEPGCAWSEGFAEWTITFTAPDTGFYGVVVINRSGSGSYELSRQGG